MILSQTAWSQRAFDWRHYRLADGLPESGCISITFSPQGKLLARHLTQPLLSELDGYSIRTLASPETGKSRVYQSPGGQLWTVEPDGLEEFRDGTWSPRPVPELADKSRTLSGEVIDPVPLCAIRQGQVLLLLPDRLLEFNGENPDRARTRVLRLANQTRLERFSGMTLARDGGLWLAGERGLAKVAGPVRNLRPDTAWREFPMPEELALHDLQAIHEDADGGIVALAQSATNAQRGIVHFTGQTWEVWVPETEKLRQAWPGPDKSRWAMSIDSLFQWDETKRELRPNEEISPRRYFDLALEPGGSFWLATSDGLFRYAPSLWRSPAALRQLNAPVRCLLSDPEERLWVVSGPGLHSLQNGVLKDFPFPATLGGVQPRALFRLNNGTLVIVAGDSDSSGSDRLFRFDPVQGLFFPLVPEQAGTKLKCLGGLRNGNLCLQGSGAGSPADGWFFLQYDGQEFQRVADPPPVPALGPNVYSMMIAHNGDLWLGSELGTAVYHEKTWRTFVAADKSAPEQAFCFAELPDGKVWCGTQAQVWEFDGRNWSVVRRGFDRINDLQRTRDGSVWVASNSGLFRFYQGAWVENGVEEGLPSTAVRQLQEDQRGQLWAATSRGISLFHPETDPDPPQTTIEPLSENGDTVPASPVITVSFRGLDKWKYTPSDRLLYSYRRDEQDWSPFQELTRIPLSELPAGKHVFQVRAMDRNCNIESKVQREFLVVLPWYRERRLVRIASAGLVAALFFAGLAFNRHRQLLRSYAEVEKKVAERTHQLEIANRELVHSQKMNALGTLAAGIAHDFNNILSIIKGSAQIIEDNLDNPDKVRTRADRIKTVVEQGAGIVKAMLGFSRESDLPPGPCDLNSIVNDTLRLLGDRFLREVQVQFQAAPALPLVNGSKDLIQQILLNFLFNAAESMPHNKQILLSTHVLEKLPPALVLPPAASVPCVAVSVQDSGCGIPQENLSRIFEPFFTTKALSARRGTGLGLSMVYELAKKLGAGLAVDSVVDQGSTFTLILPIHTEPSSST